MAVPPLYHPCWKKLASGHLQQIELRNAAAQMLAKRFERDDRTPLPDRAVELHEFFTRWERTLSHELAQFDHL
jgi:hypothetical protein